jgi:hypothetical protein
LQAWHLVDPGPAPVGETLVIVVYTSSRRTHSADIERARTADSGGRISLTLDSGSA